MKIWCLPNDQLAHIQPVEAALRGEARFIYDGAGNPEAMIRQKPDLLLCVNDYPYDIARCLDVARAHRIPTLALQDGILEWRCQYQNPLFGAGGGAPQHQPVLADKIACIGMQSARQIAAWNGWGKVEVTGMPRLDFLFKRKVPPPASPGKTLLIMTAKNPGFTPEQRRVMVRSLRDLKSHLTTLPGLSLLWRVSKSVACELEVDNQLRQVSSLELVALLDQADAVITTPSTAMLEAMIAGRPVAALDYHNVPRFVPTAWTISAPAHFCQVMEELMHPPAMKMAFQNDCLSDCLRCDGQAAEHVANLIRRMIEWAQSHLENDSLIFPDALIENRNSCCSVRPSLAELYEAQPVFQETNMEALQTRLARAENENGRLKAENVELRENRRLGSQLKSRVKGLLRIY